MQSDDNVKTKEQFFFKFGTLLGSFKSRTKELLLLFSAESLNWHIKAGENIPLHRFAKWQELQGCAFQRDLRCLVWFFCLPVSVQAMCFNAILEKVQKPCWQIASPHVECKKLTIALIQLLDKYNKAVVTRKCLKLLRHFFWLFLWFYSFYMVF